MTTGYPTATGARDAEPDAMQVAGAWPFVTLRAYRHNRRPLLWRARQNRKGLLRHERGHETRAVPIWQTAGYNWLTGFLFAVGSFLFLVGAVFSLNPGDVAGNMSSTAIGLTFFAGSIPFTIAGYLQHFQAANASEFHPNPKTAIRRRRISLIGWHPDSPGWLSTFAQFVGTVAFNFNTFDALRQAGSPLMQNLTIWLPDLVGSVLFLVSGYLAFIEACHGYWAWRPKQLDWWIVFINLLGCVAFMASAVVSFFPFGTEPGWINAFANFTLGLGALCFLIGAGLLMRESAQASATVASQTA